MISFLSIRIIVYITILTNNLTMITIATPHTFILENLKNYIIYFNTYTDNEILYIAFRNLGMPISLNV